MSPPQDASAPLAAAKPKVFISYRQTSDAERERVRIFAERIRDCGVDVLLDQFYLEAHPGGPNEGWPKWSSDHAIRTGRIVIIGQRSMVPLL